MGKKIKMKVRGNKFQGGIGVHADDMVNGMVPIEARGVAHKTVKLTRAQKNGHDGFTLDPGKTATKRGTRKAK